MANVLRTSVATLLSRLQASASEPIVYSRGALSFNCNATVGRKLLKVSDGAGGTRIDITDADFLIPSSHLVLGGVAIEPERGDRIFLAASDVDSLYEVLPYGDEPPYRWSDPYRTICRVHGKLIEQTGHPPTPLSVTPPTGPQNTTTAVTITGTGFLTGATVTIGGVAATSVVVVSSTSITCVVPSRAAGAADVVVTNPDGQVGTLVNGFSYVGSNTDLWNQAAYTWNGAAAAFNWKTGTIPSFNPANLPSLATWIKADGTLWQNSNLTTPVAADADRIGAVVIAGGTSVNWLQATAGKRPTWKTNIQNGRPVIRFGAEGGFLTLSSQISNVGDFSLFFAANVKTGSEGNFVLGDSGSTSRWLMQPETTKVFDLNFGGTTRQCAANGYGADQFCLYEIHRTGGTLEWFRDGVSYAPTGVNASTFNFGEISGGNGGQFPFLGDIGELVFCTAVTPVSTDPNANRNACRSYLRNRWGTR